MGRFSPTSTTDNRLVVRRPVGPPPLVIRVASVLAVPLLLYTLFVTGQKAVSNHQLDVQRDQLRQQVQQGAVENQQLLQQIQDARSDEAVEKIAREQLNLVDPGDHELVIAGDGPAAPQATSTPTPPPPPPPPQAWWGYFFGS